MIPDVVDAGSIGLFEWVGGVAWVAWVGWVGWVGGGLVASGEA